MPELPEVETVKETLKPKLIGHKIKKVTICYPRLIAYPSIDLFKKQIKNETILDIKRRGKWLLFELDHYYLFSHLRMEGKYFFRKSGDAVTKHEHILFTLDDDIELRYHDTRKFGRMYLILKGEVMEKGPLVKLGLEPWDSQLTPTYLKKKCKKKTLPIKTVLLDQSIIAGIGNIYADEILFLSHINPYTRASTLTSKEWSQIIKHTKTVLKEAIRLGGTTIRSYTSSEGVHGKFQNELAIHGKENKPCPVCHTNILKVKIGGRGTYYCPNCQK